ncbi:hypothetical protein SOVF_102450 [Spinacia oleracea]|nr:hypothetical protein SOVF_102450 [Spinacia oleracea]
MDTNFVKELIFKFIMVTLSVLKARSSELGQLFNNNNHQTNDSN